MEKKSSLLPLTVAQQAHVELANARHWSGGREMLCRGCGQRRHQATGDGGAQQVEPAAPSGHGRWRVRPARAAAPGGKGRRAGGPRADGAAPPGHGRGRAKVGSLRGRRRRAMVDGGRRRRAESAGGDQQGIAGQQAGSGRRGRRRTAGGGGGEQSWAAGGGRKKEIERVKRGKN
ncbi:hypothetical protein BS78_03G090700 [Paspalum vaginatum]|nr:hypothetical protein BS78_03G090700 [Paspalum vaginatum]